MMIEIEADSGGQLLVGERPASAKPGDRAHLERVGDIDAALERARELLEAEIEGDAADDLAEGFERVRGGRNRA